MRWRYIVRYSCVLCVRAHTHHARTQPSANRRLKRLEDIYGSYIVQKVFNFSRAFIHVCAHIFVSARAWKLAHKLCARGKQVLHASAQVPRAFLCIYAHARTGVFATIRTCEKKNWCFGFVCHTHMNGTKRHLRSPFGMLDELCHYSSLPSGLQHKNEPGLILSSGQIFPWSPILPAPGIGNWNSPVVPCNL